MTDIEKETTQRIQLIGRNFHILIQYISKQVSFLTKGLVNLTLSDPQESYKQHFMNENCHQIRKNVLLFCIQMIFFFLLACGENPLEFQNQLIKKLFPHLNQIKVNSADQQLLPIHPCAKLMIPLMANLEILQ